MIYVKGEGVRLNTMTTKKWFELCWRNRRGKFGKL